MKLLKFLGLVTSIEMGLGPSAEARVPKFYPLNSQCITHSAFAALVRLFGSSGAARCGLSMDLLV